MHQKPGTEAPADLAQVEELLHELLDEAQPAETRPQWNAAFCASGGKMPV